MSTRANFPHRRKARQEAAAARQAARDARTPAEQIKVLEERGYGDSSEAGALRLKAS